MTQPRVIVAGQPLKLDLSLPAGDWATVDDEGQTSFVPGVVSLGGHLTVVLPRCYEGEKVDSDSLFSSVALFVSSLARYARERPTGRAVSDPEVLARDDALVRLGEPGSVIDYLEAALLLWKDHLVNGAFSVSAPRIRDQIPGRALWRRAVSDGVPVESRAGVVFRTIPRVSVRPDPRHELTELHQATCAEIGARFGLGSSTATSPFDTKKALACIERGDRVCFADRPRRLLGLMRRYYAGRSAEEQKSGEVNGLFARNYAYVWERMLQVALRDEGRGDALRGSYALPDGTSCLGLNLRPDVVIRGQRDGRKVLVVLDAKDYAADAWPGSADLGKQILYRLLHSKLIDGEGPSLDDVGNAFLFPGLVPGDGVALRGLHDLAGPPRAGRPGRVVGLNVDLERVTEAYLAGRSIRELRDAVIEAVFADSGEK